MSFRGFKGPFSSGDGRGPSQGPRKFFNFPSNFLWKAINTYKDPNPVNRRRQELRASINDIIGGAMDKEVQQALCEFYHALPEDQQPPAGVMIEEMAQLVELAGGNISTREAIIRMARARFDYHAAVGAYLEEPRDGSSLLLSCPDRSERDGDSTNVEGREDDWRVSDDTEEEPESSSAVRIIVVLRC